MFLHFLPKLSLIHHLLLLIHFLTLIFTLLLKYVQNLSLFIKIRGIHGYGHAHVEKGVIYEAFAGCWPLFGVVVEHILDKLDRIFTRVLDHT